MSKVRAGDPAPEFERTGHLGNTVRLADYRGKRTVVLYFYPKDETPVCTRQACSFRDAYEDFLAAGADVIGVSSDPVDTHKAFAEHHHLPFKLISDEDGSLRRAYGVPKTLGLMPGRVTYVIDTDGIVRHVFTSQFAAQRHVDEALAILRQLR